MADSRVHPLSLTALLALFHSAVRYDLLVYCNCRLRSIQLAYFRHNISQVVVCKYCDCAEDVETFLSIFKHCGVTAVTTVKITESVWLETWRLCDSTVLFMSLEFALHGVSGSIPVDTYNCLKWSHTFSSLE